jgi:hypothetical protein
MIPPLRPSDWPHIYLPAESRRLILRDYGIHYNLRTFIETGTNDGATPMFLKDDFDALHTIELGQRTWERAVEMFKPYPQVTCWLGDSGKVLADVLEVVDGPALVWVDAHCSGPGTARGDLDTPVQAELAILFDDGRPHVILIDDMRCWSGEAEHDLEPHYQDFPSVAWLVEQAEEHGYDCVVVDDIARLTPR